MKVAGGLIGELGRIPERVKAVESCGYDTAVSAEIANDPFLPLLLAAEHSQRVDLMTAIAVAFSRNPMTLAQTAHDLNAFSRGRLVLGLGSQIRAHVTRRFSMPWSRPAARMREFVLALRAIWDCWYRGEKLDFRGEFYTHTLMTPMFTPGDTTHGAPRVMVAAVGPRMSEVAAEVADGLIAHAFTTPRYLREVTLPAVERGLSRAGRERSAFEIACPVFTVRAGDEASHLAARQQIAFYGSTPAYRPVLELHGWGGLQDEWNALSKRGRWGEMGALVTDEILEEFAVVAEPGDLAPRLVERLGGRVDTWICTYETGDPETQRELVQAVKSVGHLASAAGS